MKSQRKDQTSEASSDQDSSGKPRIAVARKRTRPARLKTASTTHPSIATEDPNARENKNDAQEKDVERSRTTGKSSAGKKDPNKPTGDYKVGKGKPPIEHQWKPGQSGNPAGRPKNSKNVNTLLKREAETKVTVLLDGKPQKMTALEAIIKGKFNKALKGNDKAEDFVLRAAAEIYADESPKTEEPSGMSPETLKILERFNIKPQSDDSGETE